MDKEIRELIQAVEGTKSEDEEGEQENKQPKSRHLRPPPQPMFNGTNLQTFLRRYKRWVVMAGLNQLQEKQQRAWLVSCVEGPALKLVEALYARTSTIK